MIFFFYSVWYSLDYLVIFVILIATSKCGIQGSRISRPHLSLFTVYKRVLHIIKVTRYYIDMQIIFLDHRKKGIDSFRLNSSTSLLATK
jgi:hypothetical protein